MPKIIKDGVAYGASPSENVWEGTMAEYNAIPVKDPNTAYYITDEDPYPNTNAGVISYDNTNSGLSAVNVQTAIDEVNDKTVTSNTTLSVKTGVNITLARSQVWKCNGLAFVSCAFTANANIGQSTEILTTPSGYNALSLTDLVGTDNANNGKPFYIWNNAISTNGNLTSGSSYFINGVFRTTA